MSIEKKEVEHIARLARLGLSDEEKDTLGIQLSNILEYIGKLNELDTREVEPTSHVLDLHNVLRKDEVRPGLRPEDVLANAPDREDGFFKVPKIINERE